MNVQCAICQDQLDTSSDIFATPCGHVFHFLCLTQWLENSSTCPQCRQKCVRPKTLRLYFTASNTEVIREDSFSLQQRVDNLSFQVKIKEKELGTSQEEKTKLKRQNIALKEEVRKNERDLNSNKVVVHTLQEQIKNLKCKADNYDESRREVERLMKRIQQYQNIQTLLDYSSEDVDDMLTTVQDTSTLITYVSIMKKELNTAQTKRKQLRNTLQKELDGMKTERRQLLAQLEEAQENYVLVKSENEELRRKLDSLPGKCGGDDSNTSNIENKESLEPVSRKRESPSNSSLENPCESLPIKKSRQDLDNLSVIDLCDASDLPVSVSGSGKTMDRNDENSPYLVTKSKSLFPGKQSANHRGTFTIGKKTVVGGKSMEGKRVNQNSAVTFNGLGGHSKLDIFPKSSGLKQKRSISDLTKSKKQKVEHKSLNDFIINLT